MDKRLITLIALLCAATATPCSFDSTPAFSFRVRPDPPIDLYVEGRLGVLQPSYARSHLVIAYRHLSGKPLSEAERAGFTALLRHRLQEDVEASGFDRWKSVRALIRGDQQELATERRTASYGWYVNCTDDAFATAAATLANRAKVLGAMHPGVRSWLDAQDAVFANCDDGSGRPDPADASLPEIVRLDREYQIAAADFYAMRYDDARTRLLAIARDPKSPWRQTARLVAARALIRMATVPPDHAGDPLSDAERELRAIVADSSMSALHGAARDLLAFAVYRSDPQQRFRDTVKSLSSGAGRARADLGDYTLLLDQDIDKELNATDDLTDWVRTFQDANGFAHANERWRATKKPHWLVAALTHAKAGDDLLEASKDISQDSPAYTSVAYHRARLLLARGDANTARAELDRALALGVERLSESAHNHLLVLRRASSANIADYLAHAEPVPIGLEVEQTPDEYEEFTQPLIAPDVADLVNLAMPLDTLAAAAQKESLAASVRNPLIVAAWTRAVLLDRQDVATAITPLLAKIYPALEPRLTAWRNASGEDRHYAAVDLLVHSPALTPYVVAFISPRPDVSDVHHSRYPETNWWCPDGLAFYEFVYPPAENPHTPLIPPFVDAKRAEEERQKLRAHGSGASWLLRNTIAWVNARPKDRRVAEALSLAINGTRWACPDDHTTKLARSAFNSLHAQYPNSEWAEETRYWYTGRD